MTDGFRGLDPCVHCGFCLPACPTYLATGDENDSPRGRIVLMQALERGELPPSDAILRRHLDNCLGCRGCEPACPSGVAYGRGLEAARHRLAADRPPAGLLRGLLALFAEERVWRPAFIAARWFRDTTLPRRLAGAGRLGFGLGMLAASRTPTADGGPRSAAAVGDGAAAGRRGRVALFRGCVMDTLFGHVHDATIRTLTTNGYEVVELVGQRCCGALHEHAGDGNTALDLAAGNVRSTAAAGPIDYIAVNSAGCGAILKDYGRLLGTATAGDFSERVRDVSELLADAGPAPGRGPLPLHIAYDPPCHLEHAQGVVDAPLRLLAAVPGLEVRTLDGAHQCCGSAGLYSVVRPGLARAVLAAKVGAIVAARPRVDGVTTGNPGCLMQIGAGLLAAGSRIPAWHPVELLDRSYRAGGMYRPR